MGRSSASPPAPSAPFGISKPNIVTGAKPVPFITPDQNPSVPSLSGYNMSPANPAQPDMNDPRQVYGGGGVQDQIMALRGNRQMPFFGGMY